MASRMPVLGENDVLEPGSNAVDCRYDHITLGNSQLAAGAEVALHVDDEQKIVISHETGGCFKHRYLRIQCMPGLKISPNNLH
jgi:hypothetical protein